MKSLFKRAITAILTWEAQTVIKKYKPTVIAITGSVGKTSTKDAIFEMIKSKTYIRKTDKNLNSEIGLPLTILGLQNAWNNPLKWLANIFEGARLVFFRDEYPKCLVLEVGADHPGDIKSLTKWLKPDIALVTNVSKIPVHVEFFKSPEEVLEEKLALVRGVKSTGKIVLPASDPEILAVRNGINAVTVPCITFGVDNGAGDGGTTADVGASEYQIIYENGKLAGMSFTLRYGNNSAPIAIHDVVGIQHVYTITAAAAVAIAYGTDFNSIVKSISTYKSPRGRMNILKGINDSTIIDDTYNSSPDATTAALLVLKTISMTSAPMPRKIAVLSDMMELGKFSAEQHRKIGEFVVEPVGQAKPIDMLITVGIRAKNIAESAHAHGMRDEMIKSFNTSDEAAEYAKGIVIDNDIILIKGSQSGRMERVTKALLADPSRAQELLVRQEPEWLARK